MARHQFTFWTSNEITPGGQSASLRIYQFIPFGAMPNPRPLGEISIDGGSTWIQMNDNFSYLYLVIDLPQVTNSNDLSATCKIRFDGGPGGQWDLFDFTIYSYENAPRDVKLSGQDRPIDVAWTVWDNYIDMRYASAGNWPLAAFPVHGTVDGLPVAAQSSNVALADSRIITETVFNEPTTDLEIFRQNTGSNGTTLVGAISNVLTDPNPGAPAPPDFVVTDTITQPSSNGAADGTITLVITGGVGPFSFLWLDNLTTTQNRTGLVAGNYPVEVTDDGNPTNVKAFNYLVVDPVDPADLYPDNYLESSPINPIRFKNNDGTINGVTVLNDADNTLYCENSPNEWTTPPYYEVFNIADVTKIQFRSNHELNSLNYYDLEGNLIGSVPIITVVNNIEDFISKTGFVRDNGSGSIRVYQSTGEFPEGTNVGDSIALDTGTGTGVYNEAYIIQSIEYDVALLKNYMVVVATYSIDDNVEIKFLNDVPYNVIEAEITMANFGVGVYRLIFAGQTESEPNQLISEWISVRNETPNTFVFKYRNFDNAFKINWQTEIQMTLRIAGVVARSTPGRDTAMHRNSNDTPEILSAHVRRKRIFSLPDLPWFSIERLALIFSCDYFEINGKEFFVEEVPEPEGADRYSLSLMTLIAEQVGWITEQNEHDGGDTTNESISVIGGDQLDVLGV